MSLAVAVCRVGSILLYSVSQSITTKRVSKPHDLGKGLMKSMDISEKRSSGMGNG